MPNNDNLPLETRDLATLEDVHRILPQLREIALRSKENMIAYLLAMTMAEVEASLHARDETPGNGSNVREIKS